MDQFNPEYKVSTKNFFYFLNLHCSYFIISLDQYRLNLIQNFKFAIQIKTKQIKSPTNSKKMPLNLNFSGHSVHATDKN